jgi:hypothetical protein
MKFLSIALILGSLLTSCQSQADQDRTVRCASDIVARYGLQGSQAVAVCMAPASQRSCMITAYLQGRGAFHISQNCR